VAESQKNGTTIVPRLEGYEVPKVIEAEARDKERKANAVEPYYEEAPIKGFYRAKETTRELYWQQSSEEAAKLLDLIILSLRLEDDGELIRWANTLRRWREPILNYFDNGTTNGFTEGCNAKIKMPKRVSYGLSNVDVYWRKMLLGFVPSRSSFHTV